MLAQILVDGGGGGGGFWRVSVVLVAVGSSVGAARRERGVGIVSVIGEQTDGGGGRRRLENGETQRVDVSFERLAAAGHPAKGAAARDKRKCGRR